MKSRKSGAQLFLGKKSAEIFIALLLLISPPVPLFPAPDKQTSEYKTLCEKFSSSKEEVFEKSALSYLKEYPESAYVPHVRLMLAEKESDTELALERYKAVVKNYQSFHKRDYALFRICQILDLKSKWKDLKNESAEGIRLFGSGALGNEFRFLHITSLLMLDDFEGAKREALSITEKTHDFNTLSRAIFLLSEIDRKTSGNSKAYIYSLRELAVGFSNAELYVSILYRLGIFYDEKKDYDRAYSAFKDIVKQFPESPEADMAARRIGKLKSANPRTVDYMPDMKMVSESDRIDISPEYDVDEEKIETFFSISVGPFTKKNEADRMSRLLKSYPDRRSIRARSGYFLYIGKYPDTDRVLESRVRLAEEYGINGNIVRFSEQGNKSYIYGD